MSRGTVGCDRPKLRAMLTDEGGRRRSSGGNRRCPVRSNASQSPWVDQASRGRKWGRRRGALVFARGKRANEGRRRAMPFYGGSTARLGGKGQGVWLGARPSEEGEGGSGRCGALVREQGLGRHRQVGHSHSAGRWHRLTGGPERHGTGRREFKSNSK
jgi:hypothetical protein